MAGGVGLCGLGLGTVVVVGGVVSVTGVVPAVVGLGLVGGVVVCGR